MEIFATRRANLQLIVRERFGGNKTIAAAATGVHANHFNLLASTTSKTQRNLGEELARRIEAKLGLAPGWLDTPHESLDTGRESSVIPALPLEPGEYGLALRTADCSGVIVSPEWRAMALTKVTSLDNLFLAVVSTNEMNEHGITEESRVVVDTGVKGRIVSDGVYIVCGRREGKKGKGPRDCHLRRFRHDPIRGTWEVQGAGRTDSLTDAELEHVEVVGRIVAGTPKPLMY